MPLAFEMQGRWGPTAERFFAKVKAMALNKRELQGQRHSFWAGFWRQATEKMESNDMEHWNHCEYRIPKKEVEVVQYRGWVYHGSS